MDRLRKLVRPNIRTLDPYSSARDEFTGEASVFLDANENSFGSPLNKQLNRYPDPYQRDVKKKIAEIKNVSESRIFLGNGSDEAIDLLLRVFCRPGRDNVIICPPTYGMYSVSADINDVEIRNAPLDAGFDIVEDRISDCVDEDSKILFLCSPNNPTGNLLSRNKILDTVKSFPGIVVVDEAYVDFAEGESMLGDIGKFENLVVLQTFSKAWGLAGLRVGMAFGDDQVIELLNRVKPPYNINSLAQKEILSALGRVQAVKESINRILVARERLRASLAKLSATEEIFRSSANFLLVRLSKADEIYDFLVEKGVIVRNRSNILLCEGCLRITVGTPIENRKLLSALKEFDS